MGLPSTFVPGMGLAQKSAPFSVWLYFKTVLVRWRSLVAVVIFGLGVLGFLTFKVSLALPIALAILFAAFLVVNVQLYHQLRSPSPAESLGLPLWTSLNARGDGSHLSVILYGFPPKRLWTQEDYQPIISAAVSAFQIDADQVEVGSFHNVLRVDFPRIPNPLFHLQAGIAGSGVLNVKHRLTPPLEIADIMVRLDDAIQFVNSGVNRYLIASSKRHDVVLALNDWPAEGIGVKGLVSANRLSKQHLAGNQVWREYELTKKTDTWAITKHFAGVLLAESGYVGFQAELDKVTRKDLEG
jgi:hypothetical protein